MNWYARAEFVRAELHRTIQRAIDRGARHLLAGEDPRGAIASVATALRGAKVNLALLDMLTERAREIDDAEDVL